MKIKLEVEDASPEKIEKYTEIFSILIEKGALDGIRGGSAIIHFDNDCTFRGVQLDYWPWRKRKI